MKKPQIDIFVSSPGDLPKERKAIRDRIAQLHALPVPFSRFSYKSWLWEYDAHPTVGPDTQAALRDQIGNYDIYLGMFWKRLGTKTPRAESGTVEEFSDAYQKYLDQPRTVRIMFYFKEKTPLKLSQVNFKELERIAIFRAKLQEDGVLYGSFLRRDELLEKLTADLQWHISQIGQDWEPESVRQYICSFEYITSEFKNLLEKFVVHIEASTEAIRSSTAGLNKFTAVQDSMPSVSNQSEMARKLNSIAHAARVLAKTLDNNGLSFGTEFANGLEELLTALSIASRLKAEWIWKLMDETLKPILELRDTLIYAKESNQETITSIQQIPAFGSDLLKASKALVKAYESWDREIDTALSYIDRLEGEHLARQYERPESIEAIRARVELQNIQDSIDIETDTERGRELRQVERDFYRAFGNEPPNHEFDP